MDQTAHIEEILTSKGLNWKVKQEEIMTLSGIVIPEKIALVRDDNNTILGINGDGYVPYQNHELLELLMRISHQTGLDLHSGGSFDGGAKVYFQLKSNDLKINNDQVLGYITGMNSFDGKQALAFGNWNKTVSCKNTFFAGYAKMKNKVRHSQLMKPRIEEILLEIDALLVQEAETFTKIKRLTTIEMDANVKDMVLRRLFDMSKEEKLGDVSTAKLNKINQFNLDLLQEISTKDNTLWALFSGVTRYTTHSMKKGADNTEGKIYGTIGTKEREIWQMVNELV